MTEFQPFFDRLFIGWHFSPTWSVGMFVGLFVLASWSVVFVGAFCGVRRTNLYTGMLSVGMGLVVSLLLAAIVWRYAPDLANEFTPWGLVMCCYLISGLIFAVPLVQVLWGAEYWRSLACMAGGLILFLSMMLAVQMRLRPMENLPARPGLPMILAQE